MLHHMDAPDACMSEPVAGPLHTHVHQMYVPLSLNFMIATCQIWKQGCMQFKFGWKGVFRQQVVTAYWA